MNRGMLVYLVSVSCVVCLLTEVNVFHKVPFINGSRAGQSKRPPVESEPLANHCI